MHGCACPAGIIVYKVRYMKITVAQNAGFCFGVRRAIDITFRVRQMNPGVKIYTLGPIIHNPQVIKAFSTRGIGIIKDPLDPSLESGNIVIIRAHGIAPEKKAVSRMKISMTGV